MYGSGMSWRSASSVGGIRRTRECSFGSTDLYRFLAFDPNTIGLSWLLVGRSQKFRCNSCKRACCGMANGRCGRAAAAAPAIAPHAGIDPAPASAKKNRPPG